MQLSADRLQALADAHRQAAHHWTAAATEATDPATAALYHQRARDNHALANQATPTTR